MKYIFSILLFGSLFLIPFSSSFSQVLEKKAPVLEKDYLLNEFNLGSFSKSGPDKNRGITLEYMAYELGFLGGSGATVLFFMVGFAAVWVGNGALAIPCIILSGVSALATPYFSGRLLEWAGRNYHPEGTKKSAIIGSYIGIGAIGLSAYLIQLSRHGYNVGMNRLLIGSFFILPGIVAVAAYNMSGNSKETLTNTALVNLKGGKLSAGMPNITISPKPFSPGENFTQFKLISLKF